MFSWVCPRCKRECLPSDTECPRCAGAPVEAAPVALAAPQHTAWPPRHRPGPPAWLIGAGSTVLLLGLFALVYFWTTQKTARPERGLENPADASRQKLTNPLQKYIEVVGIRLVAQGRKPTAKFIVVNHAGTEIADLAANVSLWASTSRSEEDSIGTFSFTIPNIGPNSSKELAAPLKTKLKMSELPDWRDANAEVQLTSP